jgi:hypothetical protein
VAQRRREIGAPMAPGAMPKQLAGRILALGLRFLAAGGMKSPDRPFESNTGERGWTAKKTRPRPGRKPELPA